MVVTFSCGILDFCDYRYMYMWFLIYLCLHSSEVTQSLWPYQTVFSQS